MIGVRALDSRMLCQHPIDQPLGFQAARQRTMIVTKNDGSDRVVLLTGATGYIGGRLIGPLENEPIRLRCLARSPEKIRPRLSTSSEIVVGDVLDCKSLDEALAGVGTAYYLIHGLSGSNNFELDDRNAASNFAAAAKAAGVKRIIYLGGLGNDTDPRLSPHLRSRHEVGEILRHSGVEAIEFRASIIIGAGSLSFELVR